MQTGGKNGDRNGTGTYKQPWHAVSFSSKELACPAARALGAQRFLPQKAPRMPPPECSQPDRRRCKYQHHGDCRARGR
jgi:hypothetical protein